jgi:L-ascorbate metabolism protein UlaG (beta-lactamase superfamily)
LEQIMNVTYFGHSCFQVEVQGKKLLFDPFIRPNPLASAIEVEKLMPDFILISHGHYDHIADALEIAQRSGAQVVASFEVAEYLKALGLTQVHPMNVGGKWMFEFGKVKCVSAVHSSSLPDGRYGGPAMGFIIESNEGNFYYAGDTALHYDMKLIGEYRTLSFALLPIGDNFTMGVDNAVIASDFIRCKRIVALHYDTFPYIAIDKAEAKAKFHYAGKELILIPIGHTHNV